LAASGAAGKPESISAIEQEGSIIMGPVEYLVVEFPGNKFKGEIVPALQELTDNGTIRILDLVFVRKEADGSLNMVELSDLPPDQAAAFDDLEGDVYDLWNEADVALLADNLQPDSSAGLLVFENLWSTRLRDAIVNANGRLVDNARIPAAVLEAAMKASQGSAD
jgi:hypothetical protein